MTLQNYHQLDYYQKKKNHKTIQRNMEKHYPTLFIKKNS